jgi:hypothetical protein
MEFVSEMDTPQKVPALMRELVKGSTISIECHNNQSKKCVHIPQCSSDASAMTQAAKYIHPRNCPDIGSLLVVLLKWSKVVGCMPSIEARLSPMLSISPKYI